MEVEQDKQKDAAAMLALAERTQTEAVTLRDELRRKSEARFKLACVSLVGAFFGSCGGYILAGIFRLPFLESIAIGALSAGIAMYLLKRRQIRQLQLETTLAITLRTYPGFKDRYNRMRIWLAIACTTALLTTVFGGLYGQQLFPSLAGNPHFQTYFEAGIFAMFAVFIYTIYRSSAALYRVRCPKCQSKLVVQSSRPETPDYYSGLCVRCKILWDLDVSSRSD